mgnify:CR=1 FL=1
MDRTWENRSLQAVRIGGDVEGVCGVGGWDTGCKDGVYDSEGFASVKKIAIFSDKSSKTTDILSVFFWTKVKP